MEAGAHAVCTVILASAWKTAVSCACDAHARRRAGAAPLTPSPHGLAGHAVTLERDLKRRNPPATEPGAEARVRRCPNLRGPTRKR